MKDGIMTDAWMVLTFTALALIGTWTVLRWLWLGLCALGRRGARRWLVPRLQKRHEAQCNPLNTLWAGKLVLHAPTGRVGYCMKICVKEHGWRDHLWPRWVMDVALEPWVAEMLARPPERNGVKPRTAHLVAPMGTVWDRLPLKEMKVPTSEDAAAFRALMEAARPDLSDL